MDLTAGDGWEKLCPFLGVDLPPFDFPVSNTASERSVNLAVRIRRFLSRKLDPGNPQAAEWHVTIGFLRDILHYHFARFENLWGEVEQLRFMKNIPGANVLPVDQKIWIPFPFLRHAQTGQSCINFGIELAFSSGGM
jgi:hypothetical protein